MSTMDKLLTLQQLAELLGVPAATVYQWRSKGYGPRGLRVGKHVRYRPADVEKWLTSLTGEVA
ncbi:MAG: DNA-binding protein [Pseudonocardiaceae bacterium]|nr:MAG: DNA-binding protein [Pseudonocardiaceae bacterium]